MNAAKPKHKLFDHPYLGAFVAAFLVLLAVNMVAVFPGIYQDVYAKYIIKGALPAEFVTKMKIVNDGLSLLTALVCLLIHTRWFRKDGYKGCFARPLYQNKDVMVLLFAALVMDIVLELGFSLFNSGSLNLVAPTVTTLAIALNAGVFEETALRGIPVSIMMKNQPSYKRMWIAAIATSAAFGLIHLGNIGAGAAVSATALQAYSTLCSGLFFAAVYIRTGNILYTMVYHTLHDIIGLMDPAQATGVITETSFGALDIVVMLGTGAVLAAAGIYMLRKSKWEEIKTTWANVWGE